MINRIDIIRSMGDYLEYGGYEYRHTVHYLRLRIDAKIFDENGKVFEETGELQKVRDETGKLIKVILSTYKVKLTDVAERYVRENSFHMCLAEWYYINGGLPGLTLCEWMNQLKWQIPALKGEEVVKEVFGAFDLKKLTVESEAMIRSSGDYPYSVREISIMNKEESVLQRYYEVFAFPVGTQTSLEHLLYLILITFPKGFEFNDFTPTPDY